jgi:hypothetical protein
MTKSRSSEVLGVLPSLEVPAIAELAKVPRWVCWRTCANRRTGRLTKVPFTPAGSKASSTDPRSWSSYPECFKAAFVEGRHDGVGRVIVPDEGIVGVDLDQCLDAATAAFMHTFAERVVAEVGSYTERSPSGSGLHIWCRGSWPVDGTKRYGVEVYKRGRYFTISGAHLAGTPETIRHADLTGLWERLQPRSGAGAARGSHRDPRGPGLVSLPEAPAAVDLDHLVRRHPQLARIVSGSYPSESERDCAVVRFCKLAGRSPAEAWGLLLATRGDGKAERADYAARTIGRIYA